MKLTIDTSVALKLILDETGTGLARALAQSEALLIAPQLIHVEMTNALWANALSKRITADQALSLVNSWQVLFEEFHDIAALSERALEISFALNHPIYDCVFLALAIREDAVLITADAKFLKVLDGTALASHARLL